MSSSLYTEFSYSTLSKAGAKGERRYIENIFVLFF
jgi:hypothetical protein